MNKIIIDMPTPELTKAVTEKIAEMFPDIPVEGNDSDEELEEIENDG